MNIYIYIYIFEIMNEKNVPSRLSPQWLVTTYAFCLGI